MTAYFRLFLINHLTIPCPSDERILLFTTLIQISSLFIKKKKNKEWGSTQFIQFQSVLCKIGQDKPVFGENNPIPTGSNKKIVLYNTKIPIKHLPGTIFILMQQIPNFSVINWKPDMVHPCRASLVGLPIQML